MRPQTLLFLLSAILMLGFMNAAEAAEQITIAYEPIKDTVGWNETAKYYITVTNKMSNTDVIRLRSANLLWGDFQFEESAITLTPGAARKISLKIIPPRDVLTGAYDLEVLAISSSDPTTRGSAMLRLNIISELPHIEPDYGLPDAMEAGPTHIDLIVKNTGTQKESNLSGRVESQLFTEPIELEIGTMNTGDAKILWQADVDVPRNIGPGQIPIIFITYQNGKEVTRSVQMVGILPKEHIKADHVIRKGFLKERHTMTLTNDGNVDIEDDVYKIETTPFARFFTQSNPKMVSLNPLTLSWAVSLSRGESMPVVYTTSYQPLFGILLAILVLLYALGFYYRQEFTLTKEVKGGSDKTVNVKIHIKNTSNKPLRDVIVEDFVPTPLKLVRKFGTMEPSAIKKEKGYMKLVWKFGTFYQNDERVLSYEVKSALGLIGTILLPAAKVKLKVEDRTKVYHSNKVALKASISIPEKPEPKPSE